MGKTAIAQEKSELREKSRQQTFAWMDNPAIQKLLDAVVSIIADEYIQIAEQNPKTFKNNGGQK